MKIRKIILGAIITAIFLAILINIKPSITGFAVEENLAITDITVAAKGPLEIEFDIEQSKDNIEKIDKPVYYYLKIKDTDFKDMNSFLIKFRVEKEWLRKNGLKNEDIKLYYLKENWNRAETRFTNEDENYIYYEAKTEVTNTFAIVVDKIKPVVIEEKKEIEKRELMIFAVLPLIFIGLAGLIGILFAVWIYKKIRYWRIVGIIRAVMYYISLFVTANLMILFIFSFLEIQGEAAGNEVWIYGLAPVIILALILTLILHGLMTIYRRVEFVRKAIWFVFDYGFILLILAVVFYALPAKEGIVLGGFDVIIYAILPLAVLGLLILGILKGVTRLIHKIWW